MSRPYADGRPRIHLWPAGGHSAWSIGPAGVRFDNARTPGQALDTALAHLGNPPAAVVIIEPREERKTAENDAF